MTRSVGIIMDKSYMDAVQNALVHTYNPAPVVLDHGKGAYLYDTDGMPTWILRQAMQSTPWDMETRNGMRR